MISALRGILRGLRAMVVSPPFASAVYVLGVSTIAGARVGVDVDVGDVHRAEAVEVFIAKRFPAEIFRMKVGVAATAIALGLVLGLFAEVLLRLRHPASRLAKRHLRRTMGRAFVEFILLAAALHSTLFLWAMADAPQLYAADWYAQGGLPRMVQMMATDWLGKRGIILSAIALAIIYVRPARIAYLFQRALVVVRLPWKQVARLAPLAAIVVAFAMSGEERSSRSLSLSPTIISVAVAAPPTPKDRPLNVIIIAADSLRADRLDARVAPNLTALASKSVRFDRAYVSVPRTFPSWVTILSGRHGHHHGVRSMFPTWEERAKDFDALPSRFAKAGFSTAVVSDYAGDIFSRIDLGFQRVDTPAFDFRQVIRQKILERETPLLPVLHSQIGRRLFPVMRELPTAADPTLLSDDVEAMLRSVRKEKDSSGAKPFFVTVFFSTAHFPYAAPSPYYAKYTDPSYRGRFKYHKPLSLARATELPPDAQDIRQIQALYDGAVTAVDDGVGRILRTLDKLDLADRTIIVITADHGEMLFDNDHGQGHGDHLFGDEGTHVPFVIYDPRIGAPLFGKSKDSASGGKIAPEGKRIDRVVRDVDLAPTLYELAGMPIPENLDGRSLAPVMRGEAPMDQRFAYAETELWFTEDIPGLPAELRMPYPGVMGLTELDSRHNAEVVLRREMLAQTLMARHRMVRDDRFKLLYIPTRVGVRYMLFDTMNDPGEMKDIAAQMPAEVARLRAELWSWMLKDPSMEQKDGYLVPREGAFVATAPATAKAAPPK